MDFLIDFLLHVDQHLMEFMQAYHQWTYVLLFLIVFCETGLVVLPFLPGDSLLFVSGAMASLPGTPPPLSLRCCFPPPYWATRATTCWGSISGKSCSTGPIPDYSAKTIWKRHMLSSNNMAKRPSSLPASCLWSAHLLRS